MYKTPARHNKNSNKSEYDLYGDIEKIKAAIAEASYDAKGRAKEVFTQSLDEMKGKSAAVQENIETYVSDKPFKTIGFALLAGWFLGYLMHK